MVQIEPAPQMTRKPVPVEGWVAAGVMVLVLALMWWASHNVLLLGAVVLGALLIGALLWMITRRGQAEAGPMVAPPDWSVTVAAIDLPDCAVAITDRAGRLVCANAAFEGWFGLSCPPPGLMLGDGARDMLAKSGHIALRDGEAQAELTATGVAEAERWAARITRAGLDESYLIWRLTPRRAINPVDAFIDHVGGKLGRALTQAGFAVAAVDVDGVVLAANAAFAARAVGDEVAAMGGRAFVELFQQDDADRIFFTRDTARAQPQTLFYLPLEDPDLPGVGDPRAAPSLMVLIDHGVGLGGTGHGSAATPQLEGLLSQLPLGLAMADRDGRLLFANAAFMRAAGHEGEGPPTYPTDLVVQEDKAALADAVRRHAQGASTSGDVAVRLSALPDEPVSLSLAGMRGLGEAAVLLGLTDSTEETRLKRQVAQATKMQAVGQLAGGVAHDFNNVLTAIIGTCDLMLLRHTPGDSDYDDIQQIRASSNRAASLTRQLLAFSRQQTLRPEILQLPDVVSEISQMLRRLIGEKITLELHHDRDLGAVRADPTQLEQVIVNLVVNARDAIQDFARKQGGDGAGKLTLSTRRVSAADVRAMRSEILPIADYTALIVEDTGGGIPPEILGKIWEPFFTTKEQGKGTGLGLSTVYGIVKQSGGFIFAQATAGVGTRFTVYLPVHHISAAEAAALAGKTTREEVAGWSGGGDILLVEDEDSVRMVAERALTRAGYTVTSASDGEDGLAEVRGRIGSGAAMFDMIVSDVVMPAMDGPAMARAVRALVPGIPLLFMSGYAEEQLRREIDIENMHFMPKPFSVQQIAGKIAFVLREAAKGRPQ